MPRKPHQRRPSLWSIQEAQRQREFLEWKERQKAFNALPMAEQTDRARWVLSADPELAKDVLAGAISLCDAYEQLKGAERFLERLAEIRPECLSEGATG